MEARYSGELRFELGFDAFDVDKIREGVREMGEVIVECGDRD